MATAMQTTLGFKVAWAHDVVLKLYPGNAAEALTAAAKELQTGVVRVLINSADGLIPVGQIEAVMVMAPHGGHK